CWHETSARSRTCSRTYPRSRSRCVLRFRSLFFFSSRRRHTRWPRDWSSDVCSSDLSLLQPTSVQVMATTSNTYHERFIVSPNERSEERRVGKECRCRWWPDQ